MNISNKRIFSVITESDKKLPFYVKGVGLNWSQEHVTCTNGYFYQWIQCVKGEGELITTEKTFRVKEGSGMLLMQGVLHEYYAISSSWIVNWVVFDGCGVENFMKEILGITKPGCFYVSRPDIISSKIYSIAECLQSNNTLKNIHSSSILYSLLTDVLQYASLNLNESALIQHSKIKPLYEYIDQYYNKPLTLEDMAEVIGITPQYLCTLFKRITNTRIFQYVNSVRIQKSKDLLLQNPNMSIKEVAFLTGFEDMNYFCAVFKKQEKMSPGMFRRIMNSNA